MGGIDTTCSKLVFEKLKRMRKSNPLATGVFQILSARWSLDASFMNGDNRVVGAVAAVKNFLPVRIARHLMEKGPHALLVGAGAERFARDCGLLTQPLPDRSAV